MFHAIDDGAPPLSYPADDFEAFLDVLQAEDVEITTLAGILRPAAGTRHRAVLTFDDGMTSVHRTALPLLAERKISATTFIVSDWVGRTNGWPSQPRGAATYDLMGWSEIGEWLAAGLQVGSHTATHVPLRGLTDDEWDREIVGSRSSLEDRLGVPVQGFAYPYGVYSREAARRVRSAYAAAATTRMRFVIRPDPHLLPRVDAHYLRAPARRGSVYDRRMRVNLAVRAAFRGLRRPL